jgi:hypothetical protein
MRILRVYFGMAGVPRPGSNEPGVNFLPASLVKMRMQIALGSMVRAAHP